MSPLVGELTIIGMVGVLGRFPVIYSSLLEKGVAHEPPLKSVFGWKFGKRDVPVLGAYWHQALGTNLIAVFFTQTYNSLWHINIC